MIRTNYYESRELVSNDMFSDLERAKIVITNYHAFKQRERIELSKGGCSLQHVLPDGFMNPSCSIPPVKIAALIELQYGFNIKKMDLCCLAAVSAARQQITGEFYHPP